MICPIVLHPSPSLREPSRSVCFEGDPADYFAGGYAFGSDGLHALAQDLVDTIHAHRAMGLAAVQIGVHLRIFAILTKLQCSAQSIRASVLIACNPEVIETKGRMVAEQEGCLSFPGAFVRKDAPQESLVRFRDVEGVPHELALEYVEARAFAHETDHTNGVLLIDTLRPMQRRVFLSDVDRARAKALADKRARDARAPS
jgi:peptide deformylase